MPQPIEVDQLSAALTALYEDAQRRIDAELVAIANEPTKFRRSERLRAMSSRIDALMEQVNEQARFLVQDSVEKIYSLGGTHAQYRTATVVAEAGASIAGLPSSFTLIDRNAVSALAAGLTDDLLAATREVSLSTKRMLRQFIREGVATVLIEGASAESASRRVTEFLRQNGVSAVKYRNGATHGIGEYARMAVRTVSAIAYNTGMFDGAAAEGVEYFEVFDGPGCGWTSHDDTAVANGSIRTGAACRAQPIAHPNCRRSFGPRPDVGDGATDFGLARTALKDAQPFGYQPQAIQDGQTALEAALRPAQRRRRARLRKREARINGEES